MDLWYNDSVHTLCKYGLQTLHVHKYQSVSCLTRHSFSYHQACLLCTSISSYLHVVGLSRVTLQHDLQCAYIVKHRSLEEHFTCYGDHTLTICSVSISCYVGWLPCKLFLQWQHPSCFLEMIVESCFAFPQLVLAFILPQLEIKTFLMLWDKIGEKWRASSCQEFLIPIPLWTTVWLLSNIQPDHSMVAKQHPTRPQYGC